MELRIGTIQGYNNKIILSTNDQKLWSNATVNLSVDATSYSGNVSGTTTKQSTPDISPAAQAKTEIGALGMPITIPSKKQAAETHKKTEQYHKTVSAPPLTKSSTPKPADPQDTIFGTQKSVADRPTTLETPKSTAETHENNKTALILGCIIVGSVALIIYEFFNPFFGYFIYQHSNKHNKSPQIITKPVYNYRSPTAAKTLWTQ